MSDLIDTTEMYLRTLYELAEEQTPPLRARIAERLHHSVPTVSQTVSRMQNAGLVEVAPDRSVHFTDLGLGAAALVMRKHRLAETLLVEVIHVPLAQVHAEACRWEHVISDEVAERIATLLGHPLRSPFGNPIPPATFPFPPADPLSVEAIVEQDSLDISLDDISTPTHVTITRICEFVQDNRDLLNACINAGILPGARVDVGLDDGCQLFHQGEVVNVPEAYRVGIKCRR